MSQVRKESLEIGEAEGVIEFEEGFTWKTVIGALFAGFIMMPGAIYLGLVAGMGMGAAAEWVTIVLFTEIARRSFTTLKKQEIYVLFYVAGGLSAMVGTALSGGPFASLVWNQYLIQSPMAASFGIQDKIPSWVTPGIGSSALIQRTFFHAAWVAPIVILLITQVLSRLNWIGLGYTLFRVSSDVERLTFPMAPVAAQGATALAEVSQEKESWRWRVFSIGAVIGLIFGFFYVAIPGFSGAVLPKPIQIIPIPFYDLSRATETIFPAALMGFNTDLGAILIGFVLPFPIVVAQFITSMIVQLGFNPFLYKLGILHTWMPGMQTIPTSIANDLDFWMSVGIGGMLTVALIGLFSVGQVLLKSRKSETKRGTLKPISGRGDFSLKIAVGVWLLSALGYVILCHHLVPLFPVLFLIFYGLVWTPVNSYIAARMFGITGQAGVEIPYLREGTFILSGYKGVDIWFAPIPLFNHGAVAQKFREIELTRTKFTSIIKAELLMLPLVLLCSFIFWSFFWKLSSIPSATYPYAQTYWPRDATYRCLWATALQEKNNWLFKAIKFRYVTLGGALALGMYGLLAVFKLPLIIYYGILNGFTTWPHATIPMFGGAILGRYYLRRIFGKERWSNYAPVLLAGYGCGMGLIGMVAIAFALIAKAVFYLPF